MIYKTLCELNQIYDDLSQVRSFFNKYGNLISVNLAIFTQRLILRFSNLYFTILIYTKGLYKNRIVKSMVGFYLTFIPKGGENNYIKNIHIKFNNLLLLGVKYFIFYL